MFIYYMNFNSLGSKEASYGVRARFQFQVGTSGILSSLQRPWLYCSPCPAVTGTASYFIGNGGFVPSTSI
jgi:hypothetical protein